MLTETINWTALPNGRDGASFKISFFLSPKLELGAPFGLLGPFPWFSNWAKQVKNLTANVEFAGGPTLPAAFSLGGVSDAAWSKVFKPSTLVKSYAFKDMSSRPLFSYPVSPINKHIHDLYNAVANDPASATDHPSLTKDGSAFTNHLNEVGALGPIIERIVGTKGRAGQKDRIVLTPQMLNGTGLGLTTTQQDYLKAWAFYNRDSFRSDIASLPAVSPLLKVPDDKDFHEAVAMLGDHPALLRMLGLIVDCTVTPSSSMPIPAFSRMRITNISFTSPPGAFPIATTPWTAYRLDATGFLPAPAFGSEVAAGMLILGDPTRFEVLQTDIDGAALKTLDFAVNMKRYQNVAPGSTKPQNASLPALRTGGFSVARLDRSTQTQTRISAQATINGNPNNAVLGADDVLRGYRLDVEYNGSWYSLCRRRGTVTVDSAGTPMSVPIADEGYIKGSAASSAADKPAAPAEDVLFLHESMFGWSGFSAVAARPGRTIGYKHLDEPDNKRQEATVERIENKPKTAFDVQSDIHVEPKSLPRLRFGEPYRFRARAVDLAGNSLPLDADLLGDFWRTPETRYLRYEPVSSPVVVPREAFREGEGLEHMVIRSQVITNDLPPAIFNQLNERHILPPKTSQLTAEQHGMFDTLIASDPTLAFRIACKEQGTLEDQFVIDPYSAPGAGKLFTKVPVSDVQVVDTPEVLKNNPGRAGKFPDKPGDPLVPGQYIIHKGDTVSIPFLPDPLSQGLALRFAGGGVRVRFFEGAWPDMKSFRISMVDGAGPTVSFSDTPDGATLKVPKATIMKVRYSSLIPAEGVDIMAFGQLLTGIVRTLALVGQHWMLTPYREMLIVHAVQRPMEKPIIDVIGASKRLTDTYAELRGDIFNHSHSTGEADVRASWKEPVDRLTDPSWMTENHEGFVFTRKIDYEETHAAFPAVKNDPPPRHEFGDTKHRMVRYHAIGTTRYRDYFPTTVTADKKNLILEGDETAEVNILSSARPDKPRVLYAIPTFKWTVSDDGLYSKREGRGLRVYMDRPWFTSGQGELLSCLVGPSTLSGKTWSTPVPPVNLRPYVSQWGADPVWNSKPALVELGPEQFLNRKVVAQDLSLAENESLRLDAVGFEVGYNADRKLWFCDIEMSGGNMYYPFVRLALARLQPDSVTNAHLSSVVKTEFAQLVADRTATIVPGRLGILDITVGGLTALNEAGVALGLPVIKATADTSSKAAAGYSAGLVSPVIGGSDVVLQAPVADVPPIIILPPPTLTRNDAAGLGHIVRAQVESCDAGLPEDTVAWEAVGYEVTLVSYTSKLSPEVFWRGSTPPYTAVPGRRYRLVLRELEIYKTDSDIIEPGLGVSNPYNFPLRTRLVYLDTIPLA